MVVPAPKRVAHDLGRHHPDADVVHLLDMGAQAGKQRVPVQGGAFPDRFRRPFQRVEMVVLRLQEVADLLQRGKRCSRLNRPVAAVAVRQRLGILPEPAIGLVQAQHALGGGRRGRNELPDLAVRYPLLGEQRVPEHLAEPGGKPLVVILGELLEVDLEGLAQFEQQWHGDRPLVVFDQIQVARRDPDLSRHLRLG